MHPQIILPLFGLPPHTGVMLYIILCLGLFSYFVSKRLTLVPNNTAQSIVELLVEGIKNLVEETMGHHGKKYFPFIATLGLYILISNLIGLIPGLVPPTANLNTTAGLALVVFFATHIIGIKEHGLKYLKRFMGPVWWLAPLMIPIEVLGHLFRPVSLSLRLFGNMMGHELIIGILLLLAPLFVPVPVQMLGILVSFIQAFIFSLLATMYIGGAIEEEH
ncbi:MAG: ATP synthase F0 subunit A [Deltaproteobacteria bacterium RIFCSPLOWO2_12_FULL_43_16]|nr:MAG: ATP synthase F0 subunit A [Deltaproteobacteria bacterium GWA2_43_19]OGQ11549.1 MAG: ATP synthase F0 subunit A [Deltaproteobacteria bacterium RIFCSPHIGHO2_02_FULL_43_33]OGQ60862.1 MAG: ATP synthase F0 subunit A [Deltaproteobacteria bacterium RIFCSPLOWO2_12_FULL_43_16]HBR16132.1 ATP synthase F0 subunit A [Deltaproteobacteria bacterium]